VSEKRGRIVACSRATAAATEQHARAGARVCESKEEEHEIDFLREGRRDPKKEKENYKKENQNRD